MAYRIKPDGTVETDSAHEALAFWRLFMGQEAAVGSPVRTTTKVKKAPTGREKRGTKPARTPAAALEHDIRLGQVWEAYTGGRVIQCEQLLEDGVIPKILKKAKGSKRAMRRKIAYHVLRESYKLKKDA